MTTIQAKKKILVLRYSQFRNYDFLSEHKSIIDRLGYVWMLKLGKTVPEYRMKEILAETQAIILKAPKSQGGNYLIAVFDDFYNGKAPKELLFPNYYNEMVDTSYEYSLEGTWIKTISVREMTNEEVKKIFLVSNDKNIEDVMKSTRSALLYAYSTEDIIEEN